MFVSNHSPGELQLSQSAQLEPGDTLYQATPVAHRSKVFEAFEDLWKTHVDETSRCPT